MKWNQTCCDSAIPANQHQKVRTVSQMRLKWTTKMPIKFLFAHLCSKSCFNPFHAICHKFWRKCIKAFHPLVVHKSTYKHVKTHHIWLLSEHKLSVEREIWLDFDGFFRWVCLLFEMFVITFVPLIFTSHKSYMLLILLFSMMYLILYVMKHFVSKPEKSVNLLIVWFLLFFFVLFSCLCVHPRSSTSWYVGNEIGW